jgi:hypothetical protein
MDPNAALELLITAFEEGETEDAMEHAQNLARWIRDGGFLPKRKTTHAFKQGIAAAERFAKSNPS